MPWAGPRGRRVARFYLTTAIDYSNGDPHLGHALEKVGADAIARWRRLRGDDVRFLGLRLWGTRQVMDPSGIRRVTS